jgi:hypothetical protein
LLRATAVREKPGVSALQRARPIGLEAADVLPALIVYVAEPPANPFQRVVVGGSRAIEAQRLRCPLEHSHDLKVDPVWGILDGVLFRAADWRLSEAELAEVDEILEGA